MRGIRLITVVAVVMTALGIASAAQAGVVNPSTWTGQPGAWEGTGGGAVGGIYEFYCEAGSNGRFITLERQRVGRSAANYSSQAAYERVYLEWWNGRAWADAGLTPTSGNAWQGRNLEYYYDTIAVFEQQQFNLTNYSTGIYWRVRAEFIWHGWTGRYWTEIGRVISGWTVAYASGANTYRLSTGETVCKF